MKKSHSSLKWIIPGVVILALISLVALVWNNPLLGKSISKMNPQMVETRLSQQQTQGPSDINISTPFNQGKVSPPVSGQEPVQITEESPNSIESKPVCGGPDQLLILALGIDEVAQSDVIRIIQADFIEKKVIVLAIPRDLYLPLPGFEDHNITQGRINSAYGFGETYLGRGQGVFATANAFSMNFGILFDRYLVGQFSSFANLVDRVGGIDITLDEVADGTAAGGPIFTAGSHHLDGHDAVELARIRYADDDFHRIDRQTLIIKALLSKMNDTMNVLELTAFGVETIMDKSIITDLSAADLSTLACFSKTITAKDVSFVNIPPELYYSATTTAGGSVILPSEKLFPYVQGLFEK